MENFNTLGHGIVKINYYHTLFKMTKLHKVYPCTNIKLSSACGSKVTPVSQVSSNANLGKLKLKHIYFVRTS